MGILLHHKICINLRQMILPTIIKVNKKRTLGLDAHKVVL